MLEIAKTIKKLRSQMGLTAAQLAEKSGLSAGYISKLESGEYETLTLTTSKSLADGLGLTLKSFLEALGFLQDRERPSFNLVTSALRSNGYGPEEIKKIAEYAELLKQAHKAKDNQS